jgi:hypothetical protein
MRISLPWGDLSSIVVGREGGIPRKVESSTTPDVLPWKGFIPKGLEYGGTFLPLQGQLDIQEMNFSASAISMEKS